MILARKFQASFTMGFEETLSINLHKGNEHDHVKPFKSMRVSSQHRRSKSEADQRVQEFNLHISPETPGLKSDMGDLKECNQLVKKQLPSTEDSSLHEQKIVQLEKRLQDQFVVRMAAEEALMKKSSSLYTSKESLTPKPAMELIKEIALLEWEVVQLEQHLLSLYRNVFDQQISSVSHPTKDRRVRSPPVPQKGTHRQINKDDYTPKKDYSVINSSQPMVTQNSCANPQKQKNAAVVKEVLLDSGIHRSHSALSYRSTYKTRTSPPVENLAKDLWSCHSQPLSYQEYVPSATSSVVSLAEHLGTLPEAPNRISEDLIKCISAIYCRVCDPPLLHHGLSSSPSSSLSSESVFSPQDHYNSWSPCRRKDSSFDAYLENPFHIEGLKEFSGPYSTMAEIPKICRDSQRLDAIDEMLQKYRSLVRQLEKVDLRKLKHKEKLAFWINIHNTLVMHALLIYGVPQNNVKRISLILKAAYNVGGQTISADTIESSILGCRMPRPVKWLRALFSPRTKSKAGDNQQSYAIEHPEPLLHFALCSGSHSDPAIRMYTPKRVFQELETAKEEYIRATLGIRKEQKILLPKIVENFVKDSGLCPAGVLEMIQQSLPETLRKTLRPFHEKSRKCFEWLPHNFAFRYLISNELVR
ncbi:hypothetical protein IFM89_010940 [Coptis chinensis]|uniref:Uncharacterized protein n=1 Tax=Coptis chinensis TaxID=261450 RepID=A0A835ILV3_9MAGN|nr:hypothetical protein IFM89_010940 [Coptis chinensis]